MRAPRARMNAGRAGPGTPAAAAKGGGGGGRADRGCATDLLPGGCTEIERRLHGDRTEIERRLAVRLCVCVGDQADRTIEFHAKFGTYYKTRIPKAGERAGQGGERASEREGVGQGSRPREGGREKEGERGRLRLRER